MIVMCPDIENFAPLIQARFGAGEVALDGGGLSAPVDDGGRVDLPVRIADRSLRQTNAVLAVVADLLDLVPQRITASQVLDFADREPVRRWFRIDESAARLRLRRERRPARRHIVFGTGNEKLTRVVSDM